MRRLRCFRYMLPVQALTRRCLSHTEGASCPTRSSRKQRAPIKPSPTRSSTSIWTPLARALMKCRTSPTRRSGVICPTLGSRADTPAALCAHCRVTRLRRRPGRRDVLLADPEPLGDHPQGPGLPGRVEPSAAPTASDQRVRRRLRPGRTHHDLLDRRASILAYWFKTHPSRWEQKQPAVGQAGRRRLTADGPRSPARITLRCRRGGPARVARADVRALPGTQLLQRVTDTLRVRAVPLGAGSGRLRSGSPGRQRVATPRHPPVVETMVSLCAGLD